MLVHSASERSVRYALLMLGRMPTSKEPISGPPKDLLKISLSRHAESKAKASKQTRTLNHPLEAYRLCIGSQQGAEAQLKLDGALGMTCPPRSPQHWEVISVIGSMGNSRMNADPATPPGLIELDTRRFLMDLLRIIFAILLPPLGVFLQVGIGKHFWINILLTILGYIPGIVHAIWVIAKY
jgi:uncharacterized membrane protein YqaE (UPF0057 family)